MGLIAPVTLVGATIFHTVDVLAGIVMAQIIRPGTPVLFGGAPAAFHMKAATSPMAAIEALHLDCAYVAVAKYLDLPTQAYMALSDAKVLDAQAGGETFGSALLAALAGINSVAGPGMLDYLLAFSLPKLLFDDEMCGQALHFIREILPVDDLPALDLARELLSEEHLITSEHTLQHWQDQLYFPGDVVDRQNRDNWTKQGQRKLPERAKSEVEYGLLAYESIDTNPKAIGEMRRLLELGMSEEMPLPAVPVPTTKPHKSSTEIRRRRRRKRP